MSLVMALPAGQDEHQQAHHNHHHHGGPPVKDWKTESNGRPSRVNDSYKISLGVMVVCWVLGLAVFATELLWKQPEIGLVQLDNLPKGNGSESILIASTGVYYRPDDTTVWHETVSMFGSARYTESNGKGLPDYASDVANVLGGPRTIMPSLLIAYAFGLLLALLLGASTAIIAELVGPDFLHKHHHIYRPMILKSCVCFLAYTVAINMAALMVPWTIKSSVRDYNVGSANIKAETQSGIWMLLISLALHMGSLVAGFHMIAKQRMHLRHPGWVIAVYEQERRRRHAMKHHKQYPHVPHGDAKAPSGASSTSSQDTLVGAEDKQAHGSHDGSYPTKGAFPQQQGQSFGDQPYGASVPAQQKPSYGSASVSQQAQAPPPQASGSLNPYATQQGSQYHSTAAPQQQQNVPFSADQGTYGAPAPPEVAASGCDGGNEGASVYPLSLKKSRRTQKVAGSAAPPPPASLQPGGMGQSKPDGGASAPGTQALQGDAAAYYQNSLSRSQKSKKIAPPPAPSTMDPFPKGNYSNMYKQ